MIPAALGILGASLLGSVHCAAMCGGFVCFYAGSDADRTPRAALPHVAYNAGRLVSYMTLGAAAGVLGAGITKLGILAGVGRAATIMAGALMVLWGASTLAAQRDLHLFAMHAPLRWQQALGGLLQLLRAQPPVLRAAATGLLTTLLPCGWLYAFVVTAGGTGSARDGALVMFLFWLGTVPALVSVGVGAQRLFGPIRRRLPLVGATAVMIMGLLAIFGRLELQTASHAMHAGNPVSSTSHAVYVGDSVASTSAAASSVAAVHDHGH